MNLLVFYTFFLLLNFILSEDKVVSLCENPIINSADRVLNGSVRVYRGDYYWELIGLNSTQTNVSGPFKIWFPGMAPIDEMTSIMTVINAKPARNGHTYKFREKRWWSWDTKGVKVGEDGWRGFVGNGYYAVYNDANMDDTKDHAVMVAFQPIRVFYFNTGDWDFEFDDKNRDGYNLSGRSHENFPGDVTSAVAVPSPTPNHKYYVYLFRHDKYCYRPINGTNEEKDCKTKWKLNRELFGCKTESHSQTSPPEAPAKLDTTTTIPSTKGPENFAVFTTNKNLRVIFILITFSVIFFNLIQ